MSIGHDTSFPPIPEPSPAVAVEDVDTLVRTAVLAAANVMGQGAPRLIDRLTSEQRKEFPMCTGVLDYAPDAIAAIAHISWLGNQKHNAGQPLHHARGKSNDHADCIVRHQSTRLDSDPAYQEDVLAPVFHMAEQAWRSLIQLQERMEEVYGLALAPGARAG